MGEPLDKYVSDRLLPVFFQKSHKNPLILAIKKSKNKKDPGNHWFSEEKQVVVSMFYGKFDTKFVDL